MEEDLEEVRKTILSYSRLSATDAVQILLAITVFEKDLLIHGYGRQCTFAWALHWSRS
jgi:hypothetical protein